MRNVVLAAFLLAGIAAGQPASDPQRVSSQAVDALKAGRSAEVWRLLRATEDNTVRSLIIRDLSRLGADPSAIVQRLRIDTDPSARRALILALGGYRDGQLSASLRTSLDATLRERYASDPDPGVHSAIRWLRRQWGANSIAESPSPIRPGLGWYVTAERHAMTLINGPQSFTMGSPAGETGRQPASDSPPEPLHAVTIPRPFAIATSEVTIAQFRRFLDANPDVKRAFQYPDSPNRMAEVLARFSPTDDGPAIAVTWYEAAMYCNWLSAREGIPPSEWVYPTGHLADGMKLPADYLRRRGYRLPTEAEWELAARAGTRTARFFGVSPELLSEYAWYSRNPPRTKDDPVDPADPQRTMPVERLKPNDFGLFDVYGNVWEWTQDRVERHSAGNVIADHEDSVLEVLDQQARTRRGGAFPYEAAMERSAARGTVNSFPHNRRDNVGFRIARTVTR